MDEEKKWKQYIWEWRRTEMEKVWMRMENEESVGSMDEDGGEGKKGSVDEGGGEHKDR